MSKPQWFLDLNPLGKVPTVIVSTHIQSNIHTLERYMNVCILDWKGGCHL